MATDWVAIVFPSCHARLSRGKGILGTLRGVWSLMPSRTLLTCFGNSLGPSWTSWGTVLHHLGWPCGYIAASWGAYWSLSQVVPRSLGPRGARSGAFLDVFVALLEIFWDPLETIVSDRGAILRPQKPIGNETAKTQTTIRKKQTHTRSHAYTDVYAYTYIYIYILEPRARYARA